MGVGKWYLKRAARLQKRYSRERWIRCRSGLVISTGGFIMNPRMVQHFAPAYIAGMPNGTLGDQGQGILMGASAGGALGLMSKISAWRFINPPKAWSDGIVVNRQGKRIVDETVYGATLGEEIGDRNDGVAYVIYDSRLRKLAFRQALDPNLAPLQRDITLVNLAFNSIKAKTLDELAVKVGLDRATLADTVRHYNAAARGEELDPFGKLSVDMAELAHPPFYAMDISVASKWLPMPTMSFGGLRVDEESGLVLDEAGKTIPGLYAAGRAAVGIPSNTYLSGLSFADCFFSGRRAARHAARANH
jgi:3-oxo-5alpha-steroid 4-dehydrogenase